MTLRFCEKDTGIGISKENVNHIFGAFEQLGKDTSKNFRGIGLGLTISNSLVQLMGSKIEVKSEVQIGSEFSFILSFTFAKNQEEVKKLENLEESDYNFQGKRILLAEDNELNREIAAAILQMYGFLIESAENGKEAVECFKKQEAYYYNAILMDIHMPVMDGLETAKIIRILEKEDSRTILIIAMTVNAFDEDMKKSLDSGMNGHLSKPIQMDKLLKMLWCCMEEESRGNYGYK